MACVTNGGSYAQGMELIFSTEIKNPDDELVNPDDVWFLYAPLSGDQITLQYGVDPEITNPSVGVYEARVVPLTFGGWTAKWASQGDVTIGSDDLGFTIKTSKLTLPS